MTTQGEFTVCAHLLTDSYTKADQSANHKQMSGKSSGSMKTTHRAHPQIHTYFLLWGFKNHSNTAIKRLLAVLLQLMYNN